MTSITVDGKRLSVKRIEQGQRDQLLGKLVRAIVVRAVGDGCANPICLEVSANKMVCGRLRSRIRRVGRVSCRFAEEAVLTKRAVNFVGRDVKETEAFPSIG